MNKQPRRLLNSAIAAILFSGGAVAAPDAITQAITDGTAFGDLRLRYENVEAGSTDADALMLRSRIGYKTQSYEGFSALVEFEDAREVLGIEEEDDSAPVNTILDAEMTELDQGFLQYKYEMVTAKLGRQVITLDGHRHVGHVGWRQDRQTFDAARVIVSPAENLTIDASYVYRVNRINSPVFSDIRGASHKLINLAYASTLGKIAAYNYDLSAENSGPAWDETSTVGASFTGKAGEEIKFLYALEYARQDNKSADVDTDYKFLELGASYKGVTGKLGYEVLGSDDGKKAFSTPLATVHKFGGWADVFAAPSLFGTVGGGNGLEDKYLSIGGKVKGVKLAAVYHDYASDVGGNDLGDEIDLLVAKKFNKTYNAGLKYADYSAPTGGTDKTVMWAWVGMSF